MGGCARKCTEAQQPKHGKKGGKTLGYCLSKPPLPLPLPFPRLKRPTHSNTHSPNRLELSFLTVLALPNASRTVLLLSRTSSMCLAAAAAVAAGEDDRHRPSGRKEAQRRGGGGVQDDQEGGDGGRRPRRKKKSEVVGVGGAGSPPYVVVFNRNMRRAGKCMAECATELAGQPLTT